MRHTAASLALAALLAVTTAGCAVTRNQSTVGEYLEDSVITTRVKTKFAQDSRVSAMSISVGTLKGVVQLSGSVKNLADRTHASTLAGSVSGVKGVVNNIVIKP
jgi:osmotically-inducible protein OsmY